jgi:hypothetical protein
MDSNVLTTTEAISNLKKRIESVKLPENLVKNLEELFAQLSINSRNEESFWQNYQSVSKYISYLTNVPWFAQTKDILDIQFAKENRSIDTHGHSLYAVIGQGNAVLLQNGDKQEITWSKTSRQARTIYKDKAGKEINLVPGSVWVEILPLNNQVKYEN